MCSEETLEHIRTILKGEPDKLVPREPKSQGGSFGFREAQLRGDWAENIVQQLFNEKWDSEFKLSHYGIDYAAVIGTSDFDRETWDKNEADRVRIGKRPDFLLFYEGMGVETDISKFTNSELDDLVPNAKAAIEVKASAIDVREYTRYVEEAKNSQEEIRSRIEELTGESFVDAPRKVAETDLQGNDRAEYNNLTKTWRSFRTRNLHFTVTISEIPGLYWWISKYGVNHYYVQCFFDRLYIIPTITIFQTIVDEDLKIKKDSGPNRYEIPLSKGIMIGAISEPPIPGVAEFMMDQKGMVKGIFPWVNGVVESNQEALDNVFKN